MRLAKDARLSLPLTEVMKIARLTSPLLIAPRQSSPRPRLMHGRRLALLSRSNLTLTLYTLAIALSLALLPHIRFLLTYLTVLLPGNRLWTSSLTWDPTFPFFSQRPCVADPEATFLSSAMTRARRSLIRPSALLSPPLNFCSCLQPFLSTATGPDKVAYPMLKPLSRSVMDFLLHIFNLSWSLRSFPSIWRSSIIFIHMMEKLLDSSASFRPISLPSCVSKLFERIILTSLLFFLKCNSILSPSQAGFLPGLSTLDQFLFLS